MNNKPKDMQQFARFIHHHVFDIFPFSYPPLYKKNASVWSILQHPNNKSEILNGYILDSQAINGCPHLWKMFLTIAKEKPVDAALYKEAWILENSGNNAIPLIYTGKNIPENNILLVYNPAHHEAPFFWIDEDCVANTLARILYTWFESEVKDIWRSIWSNNRSNRDIYWVECKYLETNHTGKIAIEDITGNVSFNLAPVAYANTLGTLACQLINFPPTSQKQY